MNEGDGVEPLEADDPAEIGTYRLVARLGAGGMGRVYLARSAGGRTVAVKVVRPELAGDPDFRARFRREVASARSVSGGFTAPVVDADRDSPSPWLATAYVPGPSLAQAVSEFGPLPAGSVRVLGAVLAEALRAVHGAGLVHRDLKPSNVLLAVDGPRVIDFGIARALDEVGLTSTGVVVGSPGFMSPEQASGRPVGPPGDVFALGAVLVFASTGRGPFGQESAASLLYRVVHEPPELAGVPHDLLPTVTACLAKDPQARPTPDQVLAALAAEGVAAQPGNAWLPAEVASAIARHAATVMELETPLPAPAAGGDPRVPAAGAAAQPGRGDRGDRGTVLLGNRDTGPDAGPPTAASEATSFPSPPPSTASVPPGRSDAVSRRTLVYAGLGIVALGAAGGGTALALSQGGGAPTPSPSASRSGTATAAPSATATRPPGVPPQPLWSYTANQAVQSPALAADGMVAVAGQEMVTLRARSGALQWTGPQVSSSYQQQPVAYGGGLFVTLNQDGSSPALSAYDPATGAQRWTLPEPAQYAFTSLLAVNDQAAFLIGNQYKLDAHGQPIIVFGDDTSTQVVMAVDLHTRQVLWTQHRTVANGYDVLGFATSGYLVYTNDKNNIVVRDTRTGAQLWSQDYGNPKWQNPVLPLLGGDTLFLPGPQLSGYGLAKGDSRLSSAKLTNADYDSLAYADGRLYLTQGDGTALALDAHTGAQIWTSQVDTTVSRTPMVVVADTVFCPVLINGQSSGVTALDVTSGKALWTFQDGDSSTDEWWLSTDGTQLYAVHGSHVYALPPR
ncbi:protein kinase domain-containing protein [Streptacidiphilus fuscans]|uniref:PQQ-binding-like beta-propeller repeat protein n=1 Tax=Streptacidiphilus fuscans TaxID=2789292 RepID=A0A931AXZ0_9ACTN|nr:PQQ-binding-like beta-propeller repeat protein [Streptacidiphilus fuscans]MBF9066909.1 PQQ-binding-like beta-propeller repeat protein [Streptacidiphilus fuscans]